MFYQKYWLNPARSSTFNTSCSTFQLVTRHFQTGRYHPTTVVLEYCSTRSTVQASVLQYYRWYNWNEKLVRLTHNDIIIVDFIERRLYSLPSLKTTLTLNHRFINTDILVVACWRCRQSSFVVIVIVIALSSFLVAVVLSLSSIVDCCRGNQIRRRRWLLSSMSLLFVRLSLFVVRCRRWLLLVACFPPLSSILEAVMWREFELTCSNSIWFRVECAIWSVGVVFT